jgi:hypothetical protein
VPPNRVEYYISYFLKLCEKLCVPFQFSENLDKDKKVLRRSTLGNFSILYRQLWSKIEKIGFILTLGKSLL